MIQNHVSISMNRYVEIQDQIEKINISRYDKHLK